MMKPFRDLTQADIDAGREGCAHVLVAVGFLGKMQVFLDLDLPTIRERFVAEFCDGDAEMAKDNYSAIVHGIDDTFVVYDLEW